MTIHELVQGARTRLMEAGISAGLATLDSEVLARQVLGWDQARFLSDRHETASSTFLLNFEHLVARRVRREPVSYITGTREFWGLDLEVGPDVLIPRPETEFIVEETLARVQKDSAPVIIDIGTGSGCIAIALALEIPGAKVIATDISPAALAVARRNAARHGVADRMRFVETSFLDGVHDIADFIVSNPPYVPSLSGPGLTPEVRDYEPSVALFGGEDGLEGLQRVLQASAARLAPNGWLIMEFGYGQDDQLPGLLQHFDGLALSAIRHDFQEIPRVAVIRNTA